VVSAFARVVRRDRALAECNVVRFRHADIQVHFRRQLKRFLGLTKLKVNRLRERVQITFP
jgi:hypothetical protein